MFRSWLDEISVRAAIAAASGAGATVSGSDWARELFGSPFTVLFAGFAGALIAVAVMPPLKRWWASLGAGTIASAYTTSTALLWIHSRPGFEDTDARAVAFCIGLIAYFLLSLAFQDGREIILGWLRAKFPTSKKEDR